MLDSIRRACASSPSSRSPVDGLRPVCPVTKTRSPLRMACEYVPTAGGAAFVAIFVLFTIDVLPPLDAPRNAEVKPRGRAAPRREIEQLRLSRKDDLHRHDVRRIVEVEIEVVELGDIRRVDP